MLFYWGNALQLLHVTLPVKKNIRALLKYFKLCMKCRQHFDEQMNKNL